MFTITRPRSITTIKHQQKLLLDVHSFAHELTDSRKPITDARILFACLSQQQKKKKEATVPFSRCVPLSSSRREKRPIQEIVHEYDSFRFLLVPIASLFVRDSSLSVCTCVCID